MPQHISLETSKIKNKKMGVVFGQNLGQIRSNVVKKSKETGIINRFFSYFAQGIHFKARRVVIQTP